MKQDAVYLSDRKAHLQEIKDKRGYLLDYHKVMAAEDLPFLQALGNVLNVAYSSERSLSKKVKELIFTAVLTAAGSPNEVKLHMGLAKKEGATKEEVLEMLEIVVLPCGLPKFFIGYHIWTECFDIDRIELD